MSVNKSSILTIWTDKEYQTLLQYLIKTKRNFEKPNPKTYYRAVLKRNMIKVEWSKVQWLVELYKELYFRTNSWAEARLLIDPKDEKNILKQVKNRCKFFIELNFIFDEGNRKIVDLLNKLKEEEENLEFEKAMEEEVPKESLTINMEEKLKEEKDLQQEEEKEDKSKLDKDITLPIIKNSFEEENSCQENEREISPDTSSTESQTEDSNVIKDALDDLETLKQEYLKQVLSVKMKSYNLMPIEDPVSSPITSDSSKVTPSSSEDVNLDSPLISEENSPQNILINRIKTILSKQSEVPPKKVKGPANRIFSQLLATSLDRAKSQKAQLELQRHKMKFQEQLEIKKLNLKERELDLLMEKQKKDYELRLMEIDSHERIARFEITMKYKYKCNQRSLYTRQANDDNVSSYEEEI